MEQAISEGAAPELEHKIPVYAFSVGIFHSVRFAEILKKSTEQGFLSEAEHNSIPPVKVVLIIASANWVFNLDWIVFFQECNVQSLPAGGDCTFLHTKQGSWASHILRLSFQELPVESARR